MIELITLDNLSKAKLIHDILVYPLKVNRDESGVLIETLRSDWQRIYGKGREFAMQYFSVTDPGIARDENVWHFHPTKQEDRFLVVYGEVITAVADNREDSPTKGLLNLFQMKSDEKPYIVLIPKGTLHGFMVASKTPAVLLNFPTTLYDPNEEGRIKYEDAKVVLEDGTIFSWDLVRKDLQNG